MSRDGFAAGIGRLTPGNVISDSEGNLTNAVTGEAVAPPDASASEVRPKEAAQVGTPAAEARLTKIRALRTSNPTQYWSDAVQREELALLSRGKEAEPAAAASSPSGETAAEAELKKIAALRKSDRRTYDKDEALQARERELLRATEGAALDPGLLEEWRNAGGVDHNLGVVRTTEKAILEALPAEEAEAFRASFDALPAAVRVSAHRWMATGAGGNTKPATAEQVEAFAALGDEAAQLLKTWGSKAPTRLAAAHKQLDAIAAELSDADMAATERWIAGMTPAQRVAIIGALAK